MSFDLFYMSSHWGSEPVEQKNQWTCAVQRGRFCLPMSPDELSAVERLLNQAAPAGGPDDHGCYAVEFPDGGSAEVFASDLSGGFMVAVRGGFSLMFLDFLFQLLKDGNLLMCPTMEDAVTVAANEGSFDQAPDDLPQKVVCNSSEELGVLLCKGFDDWRRYRDQVAGE